MSASAPIRPWGDLDATLDWLVQVVGGKVHERFVQFILENLVFTFKFNKMRL